jgi:putative membrane-bound dehydrogenase-like protein
MDCRLDRQVTSPLIQDDTRRGIMMAQTRTHKRNSAGILLRQERLALALLVLGSIALMVNRAQAEGLTPEEARARMALPEGFSVGVFASEPMIRQPVAACFDERGRMWVIEYLQYPHPAGLTPVSVDEYLRTEYDRVPPPPPKGPRGADRIKILEDTDGDGQADKVTVFLEGLNLASGLAVGHSGVFVGQAPYLLFFADRDHDDRPDGDPEVLLSGFGLQDAHATMNSLIWGPDGWLYGAQGSTVTARIRGVEFQQGIWRYEPRTKAFELFAEGGGNTWGLDFDRQGNAFGSSNSSFVAFHMVQGGYYWKGFAKHGPLHNPNTFGYLNCVDYMGRKHGGHVTPGGIIYKGNAFPAEFQGAFIAGNLLSNAVYWHKLERQGSTFAARHGGSLIESHDTWFRPIDLLTGPDGSLFVVDWYDKRASHLDPRDNWDKSNGRIYKIMYRDQKPVRSFDLAKLPSGELVAMRDRTNDWWPDTARRLLAERRDPGVIPALKTMLLTDRDETLAMRDLWALDVSGGLDDATALALLDHDVPGVRRWTVRRLGDDHRMTESLRTRLVNLAAHEPDAMVRSQLASSCQRWDLKPALAILERLVTRSEDAADRQIPLFLWWALERHMSEGREAVVALVSEESAQASPIVRDQLLERVARWLAVHASDADFQLLARLFTTAVGPPQVERLIAGIEKGLEGRRLAAVPAALEQPLNTLWSPRKPSVALIRCAVRLGSEPALEEAIERAADRSARDADRVSLIDVIGEAGSTDGLNTLLHLLARDESRAVHLAALNAIGRFGKPEVADTLLTLYPNLSPPARDRVLDLLCSRKDWAERLVEAIESGNIASKDLRSAQVLQIAQLQDKQLIPRFEKIWGKVPGPNSPEKVRRIAEVRGVLPEGDKGDAARGRLVFQQQCAACHRLFGEGTEIGPDLTGIERGNLDFLLTSLVDPSALIRKEFQAQTVSTTDGRVLSGLILEETEKTITLFDSKQQKSVIPRDLIEVTRPSDTSLMPEGMLDPLRDDQIRDLFKYLQSNGPKPR